MNKGLNETIIEKDRYKFLVDIEKTKEYYNKQELCECAGCRNYYAQVKEKFPWFDAFLKEFGVDITRPDEISWYDNDNKICYIFVGFTACGKVLNDEDYEFIIEDKPKVKCVISNGKDPFGCFPNSQEGNYFEIVIEEFSLPWVLDESYSETFSTNNIISRVNSNSTTLFNRTKTIFKKREKKVD